MSAKHKKMKSIITKSLILILAITTTPLFTSAQACDGSNNAVLINQPPIETDGNSEPTALKDWKEYMEENNGTGGATGFECNNCPDGQPCTMEIDMDNTQVEAYKEGSTWVVGGANGAGNPYQVTWKCKRCRTTAVISIDVVGSLDNGITPVDLGGDRDGPRDTGSGSVILGGGRLANPGADATVYPNPAYQTIHAKLEVYESAQEISVQIVDMQGRIVSQENLGVLEVGEVQYEVQIFDQPVGTYHLVLLGDGIPMSTNTFMLQR